MERAVNLKLDNLSSHLSTLFVVGILLCSSQAFASGAEARRAYVMGKYLPALELAQPAAERGDRIAMHTLGMLYFNGEGVRQDYASALRWWRAAAALGDRRAQHGIGMLFRNGFGVEKNYAEAIKWFELSASNGEPMAYWGLGYMNENGQGTELNIQKAIEFYQRSEEFFRKELLVEPESSPAINRMIFDLTHRIQWLTSLLARPNPIIPALSTPQNGSSQQTTPK